MLKRSSEMEEQEASSGTPAWRVRLVVLASLVAALALAFLIFTVLKHPQTKPDDVSAGTIFLYSLGAIVLLVVPWRDIGLVPKKIGEIEFDTVISTQKKEQIDANVALQAELDQVKAKVIALEASIRALSASKSLVSSESILTGTSQVETAEAAHLAELEDLIMRFLEEHKGVFFSPLRLRNWGSLQAGFSGLAHYTKEQITKTLSEGVSKRGIKVRVSWRGNSLYGLSKRKGI